MPDRLSRRRRLLFACVAALLSCGLFEGLLTALDATGLVPLRSRLQSYWVYEDSGRTVHFDPVLGTRLSGVPSRYARVIGGEPEYVGELRGNAQGFADRDDFSVRRTAQGTPRIAVFGDSFTAAQYIDVNWPDRVEDLSRAEGAPLELLNVAQDGAGLANWWSVLERVLVRDGYELDGLLFAVYGGDLFRGFTVSDHRETSRHMLARLASWDPDDWPLTAEAARAQLRPFQGVIVGSGEFEAALHGGWSPAGWRPVIAGALLARLRPPPRRHAPANVRDALTPEQARDREALIDGIARRAAEAGWRVLVVHVPSRDELLGKEFGAASRASRRAATDEFAARLGAPLLDGAAAFEGLDEAGAREHWLRTDGHWNQRGSDRFARHLLSELRAWLSR